MLRATLLYLAGSVLIAAGASAQQPGQPGDSTRGMQRQMMQQQIQAADARLDRLVSQMNSATGAKKTEAMAAVINEMVAQRKQMHSQMMHMMEMHPGRMGGAGEPASGHMMPRPAPQAPKVQP